MHLLPLALKQLCNNIPLLYFWYQNRWVSLSLNRIENTIHCVHTSKSALSNLSHALIPGPRYMLKLPLRLRAHVTPPPNFLTIFLSISIVIKVFHFSLISIFQSSFQNLPFRSKFQALHMFACLPYMLSVLPCCFANKTYHLLQWGLQFDTKLGRHLGISPFLFAPEARTSTTFWARNMYQTLMQ